MAKKKKRRAGQVIWTLFFLVFLGIFCFSAYKLLTIYLEYKAGTDEYDKLSQYAVTGSVKPMDKKPEKKEETTEPGEVSQTEDIVEPVAYQPPQVDFAALKAINPDVVGWIDMEMLDISYPIVQGKDNDYYLHRTVEKNYNFSGSIFVDAANQADFSDPHTIVYGHNMKNKSMFGRLKFMTEKEAYKISRYFWIVTPEQTYKYEVFSAYITSVYGKTYTLFKEGQPGLQAWAEEQAAYSQIPNDGVTFGEEEHIVTLSTCTSDDEHRYVVLGKRIPNE